MSEAHLLFHATAATVIVNQDSSHYLNPSLVQRQEGWTERWGSSADSKKDNDAPKKTWRPEVWDQEVDSISRSLTPQYPRLPITLFQYRVAWFEQLLLRMAGIPHVVLNSPYSCTEATGPLPQLRDLVTEPPVLVGRNQPSSEGQSRNAILESMQNCHKVDLDSHLSEYHRKTVSPLLWSVIDTELRTILMYLRYEDDDAWNQVYRKQCVLASQSSHGWFSWFGTFQAWTERSVARHELGISRKYTRDQMLARARELYQTIETNLQQQASDGLYLMGESSPSTVDALLWDHLADALCDIHLVTILVEFPRIVQYFQHVYNTFFVQEHAGAEWSRWNRTENQKNPFQQVPMEEITQETKTEFKNALELMQSLSVHEHDLQEVLTGTKVVRSADEKLKPVLLKREEQMMYRLLNGGPWHPIQKEETKDEEEEHESEQVKQLRRDMKRHDELWISLTIPAIATLALWALSRGNLKQ